MRNRHFAKERLAPRSTRPRLRDWLGLAGQKHGASPRPGPRQGCRSISVRDRFVARHQQRGTHVCAGPLRQCASTRTEPEHASSSAAPRQQRTVHWRRGSGRGVTSSTRADTSIQVEGTASGTAPAACNGLSRGDGGERSGWRGSNGCRTVASRVSSPATRTARSSRTSPRCTLGCQKSAAGGGPSTPADSAIIRSICGPR